MKKKFKVRDNIVTQRSMWRVGFGLWPTNLSGVIPHSPGAAHGSNGICVNIVVIV